MDAIELLRADHERVLAMLHQLQLGPTAATGADEGQLQARKDLVTELVIAESQHEAVEEQYFWPMVRNSLPDGDELADRAVGQEDAAKQVLHALNNAKPDQSDFEEMLTRIIADGREHIEFEQDQVWPKVRAAVSEADLAELGEKMAKAKKAAPTRPHPSTPSNPGVQKTAGPMAALMDRVRDAVTGRGKR
ncbi:MAG TPA: hemerythrin domain-containing protein [Pseudonocardiaceae bacterium]|jgi:hemerythrin-like domain-containing protein|nr:hemerythrin domain-containing protein [Pseudonocardiaceae bacterium]